MNENDKTKFRQIMTSVAELYEKSLNVNLLAMYFNALKEFSIQDVERAFNEHVKSPDTASSFFPKPGDLVRKLIGTDKQNEQGIADRAELAWACIMAELVRIGPYENLEIDDRQAMAAVRAIGGWKSLATKTYDELNWIKKEFFSSYSCYERAPVESLPSQLPGLSDLQAIKNEDAACLREVYKKAALRNKQNMSLPNNIVKLNDFDGSQKL